MIFILNNREFYINDHLAEILMTVVYNLNQDWDFLLVISGDRCVRIGKSTLGQIMGAFLTYAINKYYKVLLPWSVENIYFDPKRMAQDGQEQPKFYVRILDEAKESLGNAAVYTDLQRHIISYLNQCGQLNQVNILIIDDFLDLREPVAVGRAEFLFNVYREEEKKHIDMLGTGKLYTVHDYIRGKFQFFDRIDKKKLYQEARKQKRKEYTLVRSSCPPMDYKKQYTVDEKAYLKKKLFYLNDFDIREEAQKSRKTDIIRDTIIADLSKTMHPISGLPYTSPQIAEILKNKFKYDISDRQIRTIVTKSLKKDKNLLEQAETEAGSVT